MMGTENQSTRLRIVERMVWKVYCFMKMRTEEQGDGEQEIVHALQNHKIFSSH